MSHDHYCMPMVVHVFAYVPTQTTKQDDNWKQGLYWYMQLSENVDGILIGKAGLRHEMLSVSPRILLEFSLGVFLPPSKDSSNLASLSYLSKISP